MFSRAEFVSVGAFFGDDVCSAGVLPAAFLYSPTIRSSRSFRVYIAVS
jgi:hypothetical protein